MANDDTEFDLRMDRPVSTTNPQHYRGGPSVECIEVIRHWPGSLFNAAKYLWRAGLKDALLQEYEKALWYMRDFRAFPPPVMGLAPLPVERHIACIENDFTPRNREILRSLYKVAHGAPTEELENAIACTVAIIQALKQDRPA